MKVIWERYQKDKLVKLVFGMTALCFAMSIMRVKASASTRFLFLNWNLFLAIIPWVVSVYMINRDTKQKSVFIMMCILWLLFFPNCPYILTDLFHLKVRDNVPLWYDLLLLLMFAWTALVYGLSSLNNMILVAHNIVHKRWIKPMIVLFFFIAAFGVYLGRYMRWNSWDIITNPWLLFKDIMDRFIHPFHHGRTWSVTLLLGLLLNFIYFSMHWMYGEKIENE
jgi:uncharacterized membrane protein